MARIWYFDGHIIAILSPSEFISLWPYVTWLHCIACFPSILLSTMAGAAVPHAVWTTGDEDKLLDFLLEHWAAAGDGGNFKEAAFQGILGLLTPLVTKGRLKTVQACQNKWNSVCYHIPIIQLCIDTFLKLWRTFWVVQGIKNVSGWTWSDERWHCN